MITLEGINLMDYFFINNIPSKNNKKTGNFTFYLKFGSGK